MKKILILIICLIIASVISIYLFNYTSLQKKMNDSISSVTLYDDDMCVSVHYKNYIFKDVLIYNLKNPNNEIHELGVIKAILLFSGKLKDDVFSTVYIQYNGVNKFYIDGKTFKKIGEKSILLNNMYTNNFFEIIRLFPYNITNLDGTKPYEIKTFADEMKTYEYQFSNVDDMCKKWYSSTDFLLISTKI